MVKGLTVAQPKGSLQMEFIHITNYACGNTKAKWFSVMSKFCSSAVNRCLIESYYPKKVICLPKW